MIKKIRNVIFILFFFSIIYFDIQHFANNSDGTILLAIVLGLVITYVYRLTSKTTFLISGLLLFVFCWYVLMKSDPLFTGRILMWVYLFLVIGVMQQFFELKKRK